MLESKITFIMLNLYPDRAMNNYLYSMKIIQSFSTILRLLYTLTLIYCIKCIYVQVHMRIAIYNCMRRMPSVNHKLSLRSITHIKGESDICLFIQIVISLECQLLMNMKCKRTFVSQRSKDQRCNKYVYCEYISNAKNFVSNNLCELVRWPQNPFNLGLYQ